ncbi:MAG: hypothetical protein HY319_24910, partial [Armatimonadetes bacterium]|nr:hypothetical protein [Armatimonadota bacterium]
GLVETRSATINGVAVNTTFNVDVTANPLTDVGAGDAYDSALLRVTVTWNEGAILREVPLETVVVRF